METRHTLWSNRNYLLILSGETLSNSAVWLGLLANLQFLQNLVPSDFFKSLILVAGPIAGILAGPKAGVIIDKYLKKDVMMWGSLVQMLSAAIQVAAMSLQSVPLMITGLLVLNIGSSFYLPTLRSVIPLIVAKEELVSANAIFNNAVTLTRIVATGVSGLLLTVLPLQGMYITALALLIIMTALRFMMHFEEQSSNNAQHGKNVNKISFFDVFPLLRSVPALIVITVSSTLVFLFLGGFNLLILKFSEALDDPALKGILYTVEGVCVLAGGFIAKRLLSGGDMLKRNVLLLAGVAASVFVMHFTESKIAVIAGFALFGIMLGIWMPSYGAIPQMIVPEDIRGRYFAFQEMCNRSVFQLALLATGAMLQLVGLPNHLLLLSGVLMIGFLTVYASVQRNKIQVKAPVKNNENSRLTA